MKMSDNKPTPLVENSLYNMNGRVMIALDHERLIPITAPKDSNTHHLTNAGVELIAHPGHVEWWDRMLRVRNELAKDLENERRALSALQEHLENLGQAILEKANEHDWCSEYDEFAEEWNLPSRKREYRVTMYVTVEATNEDQAREFVEEQVHLDPYNTDGVQGFPDFEVEGLY